MKKKRQPSSRKDKRTWIQKSFDHCPSERMEALLYPCPEKLSDLFPKQRFERNTGVYPGIESIIIQQLIDDGLLQEEPDYSIKENCKHLSVKRTGA